MQDVDRNTISGFSRRTRTNLSFITFARNMGAEVHVVTQLIVSLLGLIVFPYEHHKRSGHLSLANHKLSDLAKSGWPEWNFLLGNSENLEDLIYHLRNALSHRRVSFSSDSRSLAEVTVEFWDQKINAPNPYCGASINGAHL